VSHVREAWFLLKPYIPTSVNHEDVMSDEQQREAAAREALREEGSVPAASGGRRRRRWPFVLLGGLVGLPALLFAAWIAIALSYTYSRGDRAGYIQKLSKKGWICKTWEGELAMVNVPGAMQERFPFTVRSDSLADAMTKMMGSRVSITYEEHRGLPGTCFGETGHFVTAARAVQ
jgi:hypothetical protein